jgi:hypothetical protein
VTATAVVLLVLVWAAVVAFGAAELTGIAENCGNGVDRWECSKFLGGALPWAFLLASAAFVTVATVRLIEVGRTRNHPLSGRDPSVHG